MMIGGRYGKIWLPATSPCFFREPDQGRQLDDKSAEEGQPRGGEGEDLLLCRFCHAPVTNEQQRMHVQGKHCHAFPNPEGLVFEIGCFALAFGCRRQGSPTLQYSWFPPHAWSFALCRACATHLGWFYEERGTSSFYGLILNRLVEESH